MVFRDGKRWIFDNKPSKNKPLGDLIDGGLAAKSKWKGIHFPGAAQQHHHYFIMVYKNRWSRWRVSDEQTSDTSTPPTDDEQKEDMRRGKKFDANYIDDIIDEPIIEEGRLGTAVVLQEHRVAIVIQNQVNFS